MGQKVAYCRGLDWIGLGEQIVGLDWILKNGPMRHSASADLVQCRLVTDKQTDGRTDGQTN